MLGLHPRPKKRSSKNLSECPENSVHLTCALLLVDCELLRLVKHFSFAHLAGEEEGREASPVGRPDFKSAKGPPAGPRWVRLPLSSAAANLVAF
jgi:hypothetical protein